jgi:hypothetical protein
MAKTDTTVQDRLKALLEKVEQEQQIIIDLLLGQSK